MADIGFNQGFQWLSGSFLEDIESLETRAPKDVDLVTFCHRPKFAIEDNKWKELVDANHQIFNPRFVKLKFNCDAYFVDLNTAAESVVSQSRYWFGLFSHRRGGLWKGLLQIPLTVTQDDVEASAMVKI